MGLIRIVKLLHSYAQIIVCNYTQMACVGSIEIKFVGMLEF